MRSGRSFSRIFQKSRIRTSLRYVIILIVAVGIGVVVYRTGIKQVQAIWAPTLAVWKHRQQLNVVNSASATLHSNTTIAVTVDTKSLVSLGKMKSDCSDLRIMYQPNDSTNTELSRYIVYPGGGTCASSTTTRVYFPLQSDLASSAVSSIYYLYFGNPQATAPSNSDNAFDIGAKDALLVCPFDGSTTCAAGEVPSAESGTARYSQNASALSFDPSDSMVSTFNWLPTTFTVEFWINPNTRTSYNQAIGNGWGGWVFHTQADGAIYVGTDIATRILTNSNVFTLDGWNHYAFTYNDGTGTLYKNGVIVISKTGMTAPMTWDALAMNTMNGTVDELRVSTMVRYTSNFTPSTSPFVRDQYTKLLLHFDENGGVPDGTPLRAYDDSGNGNHGTITGAKYVDGLVGVDNSSQISAISSQSYAGREGKFLEEGTTNKITNPSFENGTYDTNWTASTGTLELQDEFYTARAAGAVNGTAAEAGPGNRTVTDTNSKLSISNGILNFATGGVGWGNPGIWWPSVSRGAGKVLINDFLNTFSSGEDLKIGFNTAQSNTLESGFYMRGTTVGGIYDIYGYSIGTYITNTPYKLATILRSKGAYLFIKGGAFTNWTLLNIHSSGNTSNLYPGIVSHISPIFSVDSIRIPTTTFLPVPLAYDTFATAGASLSEPTGPDNQVTPQLSWTGGAKVGGKLVITPTVATTGGPLNDGNVITNGTFDADTNWQKDAGWTIGSGTANALTVNYSTLGQNSILSIGQWYYTTWDIISRSAGSFKNWVGGNGILRSTVGSYVDTGKAWSTQMGFTGEGPAVGSIDNVSVKPLTLSSLFSTVPTSDANVIADAVVSANTAGTQAGLVLNLDDTTNPQNLIIVYMDGSNIKVEEMVGGVWNATAKQTTAMTGALAYSSTGVLRAVRDGTKLRVYYNNTLVGAELTMMANTNTKHGVFSTYSGNTFDNFSLFARGTDGEYTIPGEMDGQVTVTAETSAPYVKFGTKSMKAVALYDGTVTTSINPGNTNTHTLSAYVYNGTAGAVGGTVDATVAKLVFNGATVTPTYTDVGGGWWRLSYSGSASNAATSYGVEVLAGKTVYVDGVQLEEKASATTYSDGSLGSGYSWSGTAHNSSSSRTVSRIEYLVSGNINASVGSISFWVKPNTAIGSITSDQYLLDSRNDASNRIALFMDASEDDLTLNTNGTETSSTGVSMNADKWTHIVVSYDFTLDQYKVYKDGATTPIISTTTSLTAPTLPTNFNIGADYTNANNLAGMISDFRTSSSVYTSTEVADLYYAGLISRQDTFATVTVDNFSDLSKEGTATNKITNPSFENSTFNTNWFATQTYSLQDEFTDTQGAGSVNGTVSTDAFGNSTGSTRTVTDTEAKLSITGGKLSFLSGKTSASYTDPLLKYPSITRAAGKVALFDYTNNDGTGRANLGFSDSAGALKDGIQLSGTGFDVGEAGLNRGTYGVGSYGTNYPIAIVLRNTGFFLFEKLSGVWNLIGTFNTDNTANLYLGFNDASINNLVVDNAKIPTNLWLPAPIVSDGFSTSITDGLGHAEGIAGGLGAGGSGLTRTGGTVTGGKLVITPSLGSEIHTSSNATADPNSTEANATTGWSFSSSGLLTLDIASTSPHTGSYNFIATRTGLAWNYVWPNITTSVGDWLLYSYAVKSSAGGRVAGYLGLTTQLIKSPTTNWAEDVYTGRATTTFPRLTFLPYGLTIGATLEVDNVSIKKLTLSSLFSTVPTSDANVISDVTISALTSGTQAGLVLNLDSTSNPQNFIIVYHDGSKLYVDEAVNGVYTNKQNTTVALGAGALRVIRDGTKLRVYLNNALIGAELTMTANTNTIHGLFSTYSGNTFDNFTIFPRGTDGEYATLPAEPSEVLLATENSTTTYNKTGGKSVKLENTSTLNPFQYVTAINAGNTNEHTFSAYVYASESSAVDATVAKVVFNGSVVTPTLYSDVGGGWYRLSYSASTSNASTNYGVEVLAGKTIYLDGVQLEESSSATSYIDGSLGRGYDWTSTANDSTSTRTGGDGKGESPTSVWHMDDGYGTQVGDASPNLNHLTLTGASWMDTAGNGGTKTRYISFDGVNDYLYRSFDADYDFGTSDFTLAGLFRHPSTMTGTDTLIARYGSAGWKVYMDSSGFLCFGIDDDSTWGPDDSACSTVSYADSKWHSFSAVKSASSITLYVDGLQVAIDSTLSALSSLSSPSPLYVGIDSDGTSNPWTGYLDEFAVYPYARTATQVKTDNLGQQVSVLVGSHENDNLTDGLIAWWKMDESAGTLTDSSGNGNTGTWSGTGASHYTTGKFANGGGFNGTDDYILAANSSTLNNWSALTTSLWFKATPTQNAWARLIEKGANNEFTVIMNAGKVIAVDIGSATIVIQSTSTYNDNIWHHMSFTVSSSKLLSLYVDGVLIGTYQSSATPTKTHDLYIGRYGGGTGYNFSGSIDDVRIYNRALTPSEVTQLYDWAPGPVAHYKFDEGTGTSAYDSSGNGNTGTLTNGSIWTTGKYGKGVNFDGSDDYVSLGDPASLQPTLLTTELWFKTKSSSDMMLLRKRSFGYGIEINAGIVSFWVYNSSAILNKSTSIITYNDDRWHHVAGVHDGTKTYLYIDGVLIDNDTADAIFYDAGEIAVGRHGNHPSGYFSGQIDDVRIYNYARSQKQIVADMLAGGPVVSAAGSAVSSTGGKPNGAVAWYKFDEGQGTVANNSGFGGSALNGTLTSMSAPATATSGWTNAGKFGKAVNFDGSDDYITKAHDASLNLTGDFTISTWFKTSDNGNLKTIVGKNAAGDYLYSLYKFTDNKLHCKIYADSSGQDYLLATSANTINDNLWHQAVCIVNGTVARLYIDGVLSGTDATPNGTRDVTSNAPLYIGAFYANNFIWSGSIDEVKIYNFALSPDQIKLEFNQSSALKLGSGNAGDGETLFKSSNRMTISPSTGEELVSDTGFDNASAWTIGSQWSVANSVATKTAGNAQDLLNCINRPTVGQWYQQNYTVTTNAGGTYFEIGGSGFGPQITTNGTYVQSRRAATVHCSRIYALATFAGTVDNFSTKHLSLSSLFSTIPTSNKDVIASTDITRILGTQAGLVLNLDSASNPQNFLMAYLTDSQGAPVISLDKTINGTYSNLISAATTYVAGAPIKLSVYHSDANTLKVKVFYNNAQVGTEQTVTDASIINNTIHGLFSTYSGNTFDNFTLTTQPKNYSYSVPGSTEFDLPPVAEWNMDEGTGQYANDTSGNNNTGTLGTGATADSADPTWTVGKFGKALSFDGGNYVNVGSGLSLSVPYTVGGWVKIPTNPGANTRYFVNFDVGGTSYPRFSPHLSSTNKPLLQLNGASYKYGSTNLADDRWHYIVFLVTGTGINDIDNAKIYVDGKEETYTVIAKTDLPISPTGALRIGGLFNYKGSIDQVRIYNYARTPAQVAYDYNRGKPVAWWAFDETSGTVVNDRSGNGNTGTISSATIVTGKFNNALSFNGTTDYAFTGNLSFNPGGTTNFSQSAWVKTDTKPTGSDKNIITMTTETGQGDGVFDKGFLINSSGNAVFYAYTGGTSFTTGTTDITNNVWHLLTASYDGTNMKLYVDGVLQTTNPVGSTYLFTTPQFVFSFSSIAGWNKYKGFLDDVRLYTYALTQAQVKEIFTGGVVRYGPN